MGGGLGGGLGGGRGGGLGGGDGGGEGGDGPVDTTVQVVPHVDVEDVTLMEVVLDLYVPVMPVMVTSWPIVLPVAGAQPPEDVVARPTY